MRKKSYCIGILVGPNKEEKPSKTVELLVSRVKDMGHKPLLIRPAELSLLVKGSKSEIFNLAERPDVIINRHDIVGLTGHDVQITMELESSGIPFVNSMRKSVIVHDKFKVNDLLMRAGIPFPAMARVGVRAGLEKAVESLGGFPVVLKGVQSNQGKSVVLVPNIKTLRSMFDFIKNSRVSEDYFLQEYVPEAAKVCIRALIISGKVVAVYGRKSAPNDFRSNLKEGKLGDNLKLTQKEENIFLKIPKVLGLEIVGVDFARTPKGPKIIEINSYPGLGEFFKASGVDLSPFFVAAAVKKVLN